MLKKIVKLLVFIITLYVGVGNATVLVSYSDAQEMLAELSISLK